GVLEGCLIPIAEEVDALPAPPGGELDLVPYVPVVAALGVAAGARDAPARDPVRGVVEDTPALGVGLAERVFTETERRGIFFVCNLLRGVLFDERVEADLDDLVGGPAEDPHLGFVGREREPARRAAGPRDGDQAIALAPDDEGTPHEHARIDGARIELDD